MVTRITTTTKKTHMSYGLMDFQDHSNYFGVPVAQFFSLELSKREAIPLSDTQS